MNSSFDKDELTVVWQTINVEHACHYCVPAHTGIAKNMKVDDAISDALRNETPLPNARLEALRTFTLSVVRDRGNVDDSAVQAFLDAGFTKRQILEVVLGVSQKVMSNYTNHLANTPVDAAFSKFEWQKARLKRQPPLSSIDNAAFHPKPESGATRMTTQSQALRIDIVSDVVCPWCIIGYRQLAQALEATGTRA